ncbi:arsenate reductase ArsC [Sphingomonas lacunae]|uniref:Arsenate reductase ArsC n=1 Tax=Sphingomonas lacunae TaxID=2698828 RepID=A0A6M4AQS0_9SPHN|nr:arsenate reductase ArsC [Sphingomonas lacunae]QJQ31388.1 arsenate reductase ArsC [Sphingomonas lacunae]
MLKVLFLCTGNSARSILAEAILAQDGAGRFSSCSAGSFPKGQPHPMALTVLAARGYATDGWRSKSWNEFSGSGAEPIDVVITVCDNAAGEVCPVLPGHPVQAHWGIEDPAAIEGEGQRAAFEAAFDQMKARIDAMLALPVETLPAETLLSELRTIGRFDGASAKARS